MILNFYPNHLLTVIQTALIQVSLDDLSFVIITSSAFRGKIRGAVLCSSTVFSFCTDIHSPQRLNSKEEFVDALPFHLLPHMVDILTAVLFKFQITLK